MHILQLINIVVVDGTSFSSSLQLQDIRKREGEEEKDTKLQV